MPSPGIVEMFHRYNAYGYSGRVHPGLDLEQEVLQDPHAFIQRRRSRLILDCVNRKIMRLDVALGGMRVPALLHLDEDRSFSRVFRRSYASRILDVSQTLLKNALPGLDVLAALNRRKFPVRTSLLITREIQNVRQLPATRRHRLRIQPSLDLTESLARQLGRSVAGLHAKNIFHGDLKSRHILVEVTDPPAFTYVDLEKTGHWPLAPSWIKDGLAARDLVQLLSSIPDRRDPAGKHHREAILESYLESRDLSSRRRLRIMSWVALYTRNNGFKQGRTFLHNILYRSRPTTRSAGELPEAPRPLRTEPPPAEQNPSQQAANLARRTETFEPGPGPGTR